MPSSCAAAVRTPPVRSSASIIRRRSTSPITSSRFTPSAGKHRAGLAGLSRRAAHLGRQIAEADRARAGERDRALDDVFELAHVAGKIVAIERAQGVGRETEHVLAHLAREALDEALDQERDVVAPLAQRRQLEADDVEAVVQVLAELAARDVGFDVAVGRGDHPHVDFRFLGRADRTHLAFLQHAKQLHLQAQRQLADFVEQDGAAVGFAEESRGGESRRR